MDDLTLVFDELKSISKTIKYHVSQSISKKFYQEIGILNQTNDSVSKLDTIIEKIIIDKYRNVECVHSIISEETKDLIILNPEGKYLIAIDPLDGSSNLGLGLSVGTIMGVYKYKGDLNSTLSFKNMVGSAYVLYGASTILVECYNDNITEWVLETIDWVLNKRNYKIPDISKESTFSINTAYTYKSDVNRIIDLAKNMGLSHRYVGSMVSDVHRTITRGGVFMYPSTESNPNGKLRYWYEIGPFSYILKHVGGEYLPKYVSYNTIHQRSECFLGNNELIVLY